MKFFRTEVEGHHVELRYGDFGGQYVHVDGNVMSRKPLAGWLRSDSHQFELTDLSGQRRQIEVRVDAPSLGIGQTYVVISVDGVERCRLAPVDPRRPITLCSNCGYELMHLPVVNGEVRCPECGRHTSAILLGRGKSLRI